MLSWPQHQNGSSMVVKTMRPCRSCGKETPHEVRQGAGVKATICVHCLQRAMNYELDRD